MTTDYQALDMTDKDRARRLLTWIGARSVRIYTQAATDERQVMYDCLENAEPLQQDRDRSTGQDRMARDRELTNVITGAVAAMRNTRYYESLTNRWTQERFITDEKQKDD